MRAVLGFDQSGMTAAGNEGSSMVKARYCRSASLKPSLSAAKVIAAQAHVLIRAASRHEREQAKDALENAIARVSHLSQQLLVLTPLGAARGVEARDIDLAHALQELVAETMPIARDRNIDVWLDAPDQLPW